MHFSIMHIRYDIYSKFLSLNFTLVSSANATAANCSNGDLRLAGGPGDHAGRVEVCFNGNWGSVCEDGWTNIDALTVCSILGFDESQCELSHTICI